MKRKRTRLLFREREKREKRKREKKERKEREKKEKRKREEREKRDKRRKKHMILDWTLLSELVQKTRSVDLCLSN